MKTYTLIPAARLAALLLAESELDILRAERSDLALLVSRLTRRVRVARAGESAAEGDDALEQQVHGYLRHRGLLSPLENSARGTADSPRECDCWSGHQPAQQVETPKG